MDGLVPDSVIVATPSPNGCDRQELMSRQYSVLDAFAGAGGFSLGFEHAGYKISGAIEIDAWAAETFQANHPEAKVVQRDISLIPDSDLSRMFSESPPDLIIGGPPCQGYSICNVGSGDPKDPRNSLFKDFIRLGKIYRPKAMIMENVPNIVKAKTDDGIPVVDIIRRELEGLGYNVYAKVLQAIDYGVPQIRKRYLVVASQRSLINPFPQPTHYWGNDDVPNLSHAGLKKCPTLWEAISDLHWLKAGEGSEEADYQKEAENPFQEATRAGSERVYNHIAMKHTKRIIERFSAMGWGVPVSSLPEHLRPRKRNSGDVAEVVYDQNNRRLFPHRPSHTLPASFYANFVHPFAHRNFTPREGARIQTFPDTFVFKGKPTVVSQKLLAREGRSEELHLCQYVQIGNAVPPLLAKALAENLTKQI
ncbi:MAG: DNA cytosine methyltransferase [Rhodospirillaceae bacterium]